MTDKLREAAQQARMELADMASDLGRFESEVPAIAAIDTALAQQDEQCGLCGADQPFTGSCGGGRENPRALCFDTRTPSVQQDAQAVPLRWQPIETAPMDGTVIDLWHEEFGREADCYWGLPHHCCGEMGSLCDSDWHSLEPGWVGTFNEIMSPANAYTHWIPLPPAPDAAPTPPAQRVMLTVSEILNMTPESIPAEHDGALLEYARAVIEAYERKNGIK